MQKKNLLSAMECVISLLIAGGACAVAQTRPNSPVFKDYKPAGPTKIIEQSDATYQMWQGFMLTQKANAGDVLAQHELGIRYFVGRGFKADTLKAGYWIQKAAGRNLIPAQYNLAILQYNGWGVAWNPFDAFRNFLYCAEEKTVEADYVLGQFFSDNLVVPRNLDEAYRRVKIAADVGHETAKEVLKEFEKRGYVPKKDSVGNEARETASDTLVTPNVSVLGGMPIFLDFDDDTSHQVEDLTLLREAVRDGSPELRKALGVESPTGDLTLDSVSLRTIELSAEAGSPEALAVLGRLLEKGIQVGADKVAAGVYYIRAIRLGSPRASALLWRLIQEKEFFPLLKSRVGQGDPDAQVVWAGLLALGLDYQVTEAQAIQLLQAAAERNHVQAMIELGLCYYVGRWVPQDVERSLEWWGRAANLGSAEARVRVAITKVSGEKRLRDVEYAIPVLRQSAGEGSVLAQVALGYCYETGTGVPLNKGEAARLYRSTAVRGSQDAYRALKRMHDEIRPAEKEFQITEQ